VSKSVKIILGLLVLVCVVGIAIVNLSVTGQIYRLFNPYLDREIAGPTIISSEWLEIVPDQPLRTERQIQYLVLDVADPFEPVYESWSLRLKDGSLVQPKVQLIDESGTVYDLTSPALDEKGIGFRNSDLPQDRAYRTVLIRSDKPIHLSRIYWRCYNQKDLK
jgi:hypothetical protein